MVRLAARLDVQIGIVAGTAGRLDGIVLVILGEGLKMIKHLLGDEIALLDPTLDTGGGAHLDKAFLAVEYVEAVAVLHGCSFVIDGGHAIPQKCLRRGHIHDFQRPPSTPPAGGQHRQRKQKRPSSFPELHLPREFHRGLESIYRDRAEVGAYRRYGSGVRSQVFKTSRFQDFKVPRFQRFRFRIQVFAMELPRKP